MKKIISTPNAPAAVGPYSQAVEINGTLYISGQIPLNPETGQIQGKDINEQTRQVMKNIGAILNAAGMDYKNVVKSTCILHDMNDFTGMNDVYSSYYTEDTPARAAWGGVDLPRGALLEIETIAVR